MYKINRRKRYSSNDLKLQSFESRLKNSATAHVQQVSKLKIPLPSRNLEKTASKK